MKLYEVKFTGESAMLLRSPDYMPDTKVEPGQSYRLPEPVCRDLVGRPKFKLPKELLDIVEKEHAEEKAKSKPPAKPPRATRGGS